MAKPNPAYVSSNRIPIDWRDESLLRAAVRVNQEECIPAIFSEESLVFLSELAVSLPRRGILFPQVAREVIEQIVVDALPENLSQIYREILSLQVLKEAALAKYQFEVAAEYLHGQRQLKIELAKMPSHTMTREDILAGLERLGITLPES